MLKFHRSSGFTLVEVIVTLVVVGLFVAFFIQMSITMDAQRVALIRRTTASDIAYTNLRKLSARPNIAVCTSSMDLAQSATAPGLIIGQSPDDPIHPINPIYGFVPEDAGKLGMGATQKLVAFAPSGCATFATMPIKIVSTVTYGTNGDSVVHVSYVN